MTFLKDLFSSPGRQLIEAAGRGDISQVGALLDRRPAIDARGTQRRTALMHAAEGGHVETVHLLLSRGADPNRTDAGGNSALMLAASRGCVDCVRALVAAGALVDAKNSDGSTALVLAAEHASAETIQALLSCHADPNLRRKDGVSALMLSAIGNNSSGAVALLRSGAETFLTGIDAAKVDLEIDRHFFVRLAPEIGLNDVPAWGFATMSVRSLWRSLLLIERTSGIPADFFALAYRTLALCEDTARAGQTPPRADAVAAEYRAAADRILDGIRIQSRSSPTKQAIAIQWTLMITGGVAQAVLSPDSTTNQLREWAQGLHNGQTDVSHLTTYVEPFVLSSFGIRTKEGLNGSLLQLGCMWRDMHLLRNISADRGLTRTSPFDPSWMGSLWPDSALAFMPDRPILQG
jgi:hypothetical protein